ncbi:hypothetical protein [Streptomyces sp. EKS3.2]|uniref:hypothetical protein n=1 Tax=Streptomyces sp. EKS3.2 TaxID=3461008 RepID=UPI00404140AA
MPRIQILPLPEGASDERPPFALVIDQVDSEALLRDLGDHDALVERTGARAVLVFEDTIEIPANDVSAYATPTTNIRVEGFTDLVSAELIEKARRCAEHANARIGSPR